MEFVIKPRFVRLHSPRFPSLVTFFVLLASCAVCAPLLLAQEKSAKPTPPSATQQSPDSPPPSANLAKPAAPAFTTIAATKNQLPATGSSEKDADAGQEIEKDKDGPDAIRKRNEWFYKQRSSVNGHIPAGARAKAFQHMQHMMEAEGKIVRRPDGAYVAVAPKSEIAPLGSVTSAWTPIGPTPTTGGTFSPVTGRVTTIAVDPIDATGNTVLIGGAQGGIWRSTNAGATWTPVGDQNASLAMGSIAFAPSQPATVYAGTGEQAGIGFDIYYGAGVLKSTDHGQTWMQTCSVAGPTCPFIGPSSDITPFALFTLGGTRISYVAVNPTNPQMVLVGAQTQFAEGPTEGVYCTDNGGTTWSHVLADEMSTFVGFTSSSVAYAAFGNPFGSSSGAPHGNGIYKATGIGATCSTVAFTRLTSTTLPAQSSIGRIDLGISPNFAADKTIYASISDASTGSATNLGVFVTTDGGSSWSKTGAPDVCQQQCWYDNVVKVDPNNKNIAFFGGSAVINNGAPDWVVRTTNGGASWSTVIPNALGPGLPHVDTHAIAFAKLAGNKVRMYLGNDGGIWRTDDAEAATITWINLNDSTLTLTQFYPSISINTSSPAIAFGGTQDNGSQNYQGAHAWVDNQLCGDGGTTAVDAIVPSTVYIGCGTGAPVNASYLNGAIGTFSDATNGINPNDSSSFIPPIVVDPNVSDVLYFGTTKIYQSVDAAVTWTAISGDLVNTSSDYINAIAVAPTNSSVVYAGAFSGAVFVSTNVTAGNFASFIVHGPNIPPRAVTAIAVDPTDITGATAYVAYSGFSFVNASSGINDPAGHIFKTNNSGNTWTDVSCSVVAPANCSTPAATDLPNIPVNDLVIDPEVPGAVYAATDLGVYVGNCSAITCTWSTLGTGLPHVAVLSLRLHQASRTLRAATHGRGAWDIFLNNLTFTGPRIFSITPTSANAGGAQLTLTVTGAGLTGGIIQFGATALTATGAQSDTSLSGIVPTSLLVGGSVKITAKVGASTVSNSVPFEVMALTPTLTSLNPPSTPVQTPNPTTNVQIQVTGTNFSSSAKVLFNGAQNGVTTNFNSSTSLTATFPAALLGPYGSTNDISVLNAPPGGGTSKVVTFKVAAPPPPNDSFANAINITTLNFSDIQDSSGATTESTDPIPPASCVSQFTLAQGNTGGHPNGVYNTIWYKFTPIFSANLDVYTGSFANLTRNNSNYDTVLSIWTGTQGSLTNVACNDNIGPGVILSQLQNVPLTAGITYYFMVSSFGPPDANPIALGGKSAFTFLYGGGLYPAPTITSISPTSANSGDPTFTLTVNGSLFFNGATVDFNNSTTSCGSALVTTFVSSTQLTAIVPASTITWPGPFTVNVVNPFPSMGPSNFVNFTVNIGFYPAPTLSSIYPTTVVAGSLPFTILAQGSNFKSSAVLNFNGVAKPTAVSNTFSCAAPQAASATISTADIATPGTVQVTVSNPAPGGGLSAPLAFVITQPTVVPNITSVNPASVPAGIQTNLTINGTGFVQGAVLNVSGSSGYYSTNFISSTQLSIPNFVVNSLGTIPIYVIDPAPAGTSAAFNLTVTQPPPPTIASISPASAPTGSTPTLTITGSNFQNGASVSFNGGNSIGIFSSTTQLSVTISTAGVAAGTYPITVVNPVPTPTSSNAVNFTVTGPPDFSITSTGTTSQTVAAGQTATFTNAITIAPQNGFSAQVNLSCTLPVSATSTTCSVNPTSFATGSGSATVTVTTMKRGFLPPSLPPSRYIPQPKLLPLFVLLLLLAIYLARFARTRRQRFAGAIPFALIALLLILQVAGCGGGGSNPPPPPPPPPTGTPAATYTVTVTATSGALTHTSTLTLVVQ
jgi:hypothetical protein